MAGERSQHGHSLKLWLDIAAIVALVAGVLFGTHHLSGNRTQTTQTPAVHSAPAKPIVVPIPAAKTLPAHPRPDARPRTRSARSPRKQPFRVASNIGGRRTPHASAASAPGPAPEAPASPGTAAVNEPVELLLDVRLNEQSWHETDLLLGFGNTPDNDLYAKGSDLRRWRLRLPAASPYLYHGENYYRLKAIHGLSYRVDLASETLWITAPADAFNGTQVDGLFGQNPEPQATPFGGFLNYDFLGTHNATLTSINGLFAAGIFNNWGVGTSSFIGDNIGHAHSRWTRLDSVWTHDDPAAMTTLQLGDSITRGGMTGLALRMGGIQYGTNFATQPYSVTFPLPTLAGQAALPSTVQLYVNGTLKESRQVPPGPFSIPAVPTVTGPGTATLVVRDLLGREQLITSSFYASSNLLKTGLNDYSFALGKLRDNYGLASNDYGAFAASGLFRHGFSDEFTGELRAEASAGLEDASAGGTWAMPAAGAFSTALAFSHGTLGRGTLGLFSYQWQGEILSAGLNAQLASPRFTELGYAGLPAPHTQIAASLGFFMGRAGSTAFAYLDQDSPLFGHTRMLTASYSLNIGNCGFLSASAYHTLSSTNNGVTLMFTVPFGARSSASFGVQRQNNTDQGFAQVQENLPAGTGSGYRVSLQTGAHALNQAEYDYQNNVGTYRVGALNTAGATSYQAEASGALAFIGGGVFPARQINGAFGLVEVPGIPDVTVYSNNQPVGSTDKNGNALIPILRPYQNNPVSLGAGSIPMSAQVNVLQQDAVPRFNSGVIVKFPITSTRGATLTIKLADGKALPAGASVGIVGQPQTFPVGLDGEVYLTGLAAQNTLRADWNGQSCDIQLSFPATRDPLPDLGTFVCQGIK